MRSDTEDLYLSDGIRDTGELCLLAKERQPTRGAHGSALVNGRAPTLHVRGQESVLGRRNRRFNDVPLNSTKSFFIKPLGCNSLSGRPSYGS
jgi:hypothetical protein